MTFLARVIRIYREKRAKVPIKEYPLYDPLTHEVAGRLRTVYRRMPRRSAWQVAWHQARNARGV